MQANTESEMSEMTFRRGCLRGAMSAAASLQISKLAPETLGLELTCSGATLIPRLPKRREHRTAQLLYELFGASNCPPPIKIIAHGRQFVP